MTEEQQTTQEQLSSSERFKTADEMIALHVRMAIGGETLDPDKLDLPEVTANQLINLDSTVTIVANGSTCERVDYWEKKWQKMVAQDKLLVALDEKGKLKKEKAVWAEKMIEDFNNTDNKDCVERLKKRKIGGIDLNNFNEETTEEIYQRYFADQGQGGTIEVVVVTEDGQEKIYIPSGLDRFIDDVIKAYDGNYDEIVQNLDALEWYAGIFGSATEEKLKDKTLKQPHANEAIKELIHAKIKLADEQKTQELIEQAKEAKNIDGQPTTRPNWLNEKEEPILDWLHQASQLKTRTIAREPVVVQLEETKPATQPPTPQPATPRPQPPISPEPTVEPQPEIEELEDLLKKPKEERLRLLSDENARTAMAFCHILRNQIQKEGELRRDDSGREYYHNRKLLIDIEKISDWFDSSIIRLANKYDIPVILTGPGHANLILTGPEKNSAGRWGIRVYDPMADGEQWRELKIQENYEEYIQRLLKESKIKIGKSFIKVRGKPEEECQTPAGKLIQKNELRSMYFKDAIPFSRYVLSAAASVALMNNQYNISLADDPELPQEIIDAKIQQLQRHDAKNCLPLSLFAGFLRWCAKPGNEEEKRRFVKQFEKDFPGIRILTREEILAETKPPPMKKVEPLIIVDELRENNIQAADTFIDTLRNHTNWRDYDAKYWETVAGLLISKDREWFQAAQGADLDGTINGVAAKRYQLPLAIYMPGNHGMLITKGPYQQPDGNWYINVWNPFYKDTRPVKLAKKYDDPQKNFANLINDHIYPNSLFIQQMAQPSENDLEALFYDPALQVFGHALKDEKLNERQKDVLNCPPYCLLIGGYLNALKPGRTPFKDQGIAQFAQDFHVKILTREELLARLKPSTT